MSKLEAVVQAIRTRRQLAPKHADHALAGEWTGWRDCHMEPDWILIYKIDGDVLTLGRTGTHSDLFKT